MSPDSRNVYVASSVDAAVAVFDIDPGTGGLVQKAGQDGCVSESGSLLLRGRPCSAAGVGGRGEPGRPQRLRCFVPERRRTDLRSRPRNWRDRRSLGWRDASSGRDRLGLHRQLRARRRPRRGGDAGWKAGPGGRGGQQLAGHVRARPRDRRSGRRSSASRSVRSRGCTDRHRARVPRAVSRRASTAGTSMSPATISDAVAMFERDPEQRSAPAAGRHHRVRQRDGRRWRLRRRRSARRSLPRRGQHQRAERLRGRPHRATPSSSSIATQRPESSRRPVRPTDASARPTATALSLRR